jgi:hypothetical protein
VSDSTITFTGPSCPARDASIAVYGVLTDGSTMKIDRELRALGAVPARTG